MFNIKNAVPGKGTTIKQPYESAGQDYDGLKVLSAYAGTNSDMLAVKNAPNGQDRELFIERTARFITKALIARGYRSVVIVYPESSKTLVKDFAKAIEKVFPGAVDYGQTFRKGKREEVRIVEGDSRLSELVRSNLENTVEAIFRSGKFELKRIAPQHRKFLTGSQIYTGSRSLKGKTVLLLDDVTTSGATMVAMNQAAKAEGATKVIGATILKAKA